MPELPELTVVQKVLHRRIVGQTITSADVIPPGGPIVVRNLTGEGFGAALAGARIEGVMRLFACQRRVARLKPLSRRPPHARTA